MAAGDNVSRLITAGILDPNAELTPDDMAALESLTDAEVTTIISVKSKLGAEFFERNVKPRASFIF